MKFYYFNDNTDSNGYHEVHTEDCSYLPAIQNRTYIGYFSNCHDAIKEAHTKHPYQTSRMVVISAAANATLD